MTSRLPILVIAAILPTTLFAQSSPILARSDTVERLAPAALPAGVVFASAVSADHRTIWFTLANADRSDLRIMRTDWGDRGWSAPYAPFRVGPRQMDPHLSPDGTRLLFSAPAIPDSAYGRPQGDWDTWEIDMHGGTAAPPRKRTHSANTGNHEMYPSVTADGELWVQQLPIVGSSDTLGIRGVKRVTRSGDAELVPGLSDAVNPWISPNGRLLLFSSEREGGRGNLFVQVRSAAGGWEAARSLGTTVNSSDTEFCPSVTADGQYLLFSRVHYVDGARTGNDVYVVRTDAVPVLRDALARSGMKSRNNR